MVRPLTSLRAIFALFVFCAHLQFLESGSKEMKGIFQDFLAEGFLGVSFFFILSGFVMSLAYTDRLRNHGLPYKEYFIARLARLYPLHLLTLLLAVPYFILALTREGVFPNILILPVNLILLQSWFPAKSVYFALNAPSWSISNELFFYALFPLLLRIKKSRFLLLLFIMIIGLIAIALNIPGRLIHAMLYINPLVRLTDFMIGMALFNVYKKSKYIHLGNCRATALEIVAVSTLFLAYWHHNQAPLQYRYGCYYWIPMAGIILIFSFSQGYLSKILSHKMFVKAGNISFAFYLIHVQIISYYQTLSHKIHLPGNLYSHAVVLLLIAIVVAQVLHRYVEVPMNKKIKDLASGKVPGFPVWSKTLTEDKAIVSSSVKVD